MSGKKTKLKKIELTSVDMVRRGANQEAHINLYKSAGDPNPPPDIPDAPNPDEIPKGLWKSIVATVNEFLGKSAGQKQYPENFGETFEDLEKGDPVEVQEAVDHREIYSDALNKSIESIFADNGLTGEEKISMINKSVEEFSDAYKTMCAAIVKAEKPEHLPDDDDEQEEEQQESEVPDNTEKGEEEMKIDKSRFTPEELEQYTALITKGRVEDDDEDFEKDEDFENEEKEVEKSMHPEIQKALAEMREIKKGMEMKELTDIAKKYAPLGKKEDELAKTLYDMKKSSPASYDAYIEVLNQSLEMVNKSGLFTEIGKSSRGYAGGSAVEKAEGIAKSYMEKDPDMDYNTALLKAWENNPDLMDEVDAAY